MRFRVVVIKTKCVRFRLLQEVNDLAILVRPLGKPLLLRLSLEWRFPTLYRTGCPWRSPSTGLCAELAFHNEWSLRAAAIHEADRNPSVRLRQHLRRHITRHQLISPWQHNAVPGNAQRPVEDDRVALAIVTLRILISFQDQQARLPFGGHRARQVHLDVIHRCVFALHQRVLHRLFASNDFKLRGLSRHHVNH